MMKKKLILIELNEINFDIVENYCSRNENRFPNLQKLISTPRIRTESEFRYNELEPWIQWVSVHTGKTFAEHRIFRLGDIIHSRVPQIFEQVEQAGLKVGVVCAMNAENRLQNSAYFIPDPWTKTPADSSWWSYSLGQAISQVVNDNSQSRITIKSALQLFLGLIRFARIAHYPNYLSVAFSSRSRPWLRALILDLFLHDVHWSLFEKKKPNFSTLFLNAGAHIQHHYFFNSEPLRKISRNKNPPWYVAESEDPVADMLKLYDIIVGEYFSRTDTEILLATGLSQTPYDQIKFYYRLKNHAEFLHKLGIVFLDVLPRMTRDFLVTFECEEHAKIAQEVLSDVRVENADSPLFGEIDNRGKSLFVTLTYPQEISAESRFIVRGRSAPLSPEVSFVAIKNGMHQGGGYAFFTTGFSRYAPSERAHCCQLGIAIKKYFEIPT